jgi:hypothetical protein
MSRKAPIAISLCSIAYSACVTTLCIAVSVDLPFCKHVGIGVKDKSLMHRP